MQMMVKDDTLYVGHLGAERGTSIVDVSDPGRPRLVGRLPAFANTYSPKTQLVGDILVVNYEQRGTEGAARAGVAVFDVSNPRAPRELSYFHTGGKGVHRFWFVDRYCYLSAIPEGAADRMLITLDLEDPEHPREVARFWPAGLWGGSARPEGHVGGRNCLHHAIVHDGIAYCGCWTEGLAIIDIRDPQRPRLLHHQTWAPDEGNHTHTALPLPARNLLVVTDESTADECREPEKRVRVFDVSDPSSPRLLAKCPRPDPAVFCRRGLRFGPHNLHENRPGTFRSERLIFCTYFNAGLRVFDLEDPEQPREVAHLVPDAPPGQSAIQFNDLLVAADGLIFVSDRVGGGLYVLEPDGLALR